MSLRAVVAKNVLSNWSVLVVTGVVGFLLAPFILHRLGDTAYGLYYLVYAFTSYYGVLDLGIQSSVVKYVASYAVADDQEGLMRLINTSFFTYLVVALVLFGFTILGSFYIDTFFPHISPAFLTAAKLLFLIAGFGVGCNFPLGVFPGILEGLQKFHYSSPVSIACSLVRAALIVFFLDRGYGLLTLALITVAVNALAYNLACYAVSRRLIRFQWGLRFVDRATLKMVLRYGLTTLSNTAAGLLEGDFANIIIGVFLAPAAITYYSIGQKLSDYVARIVRSLAFIFIPVASQLQAEGAAERMKILLVEGNRVCAFVVFPLCALMVVLGKPIIALWMGPRYVSSSYIILVLLVVSLTLWFSQGASTRILFGIHEHQWLAKVRWVQAIAGLAVCLLLVRPLGITGVAIGMALPFGFISSFVVPPHLCRIVGVPLSSLLARAYLPPLALCAPFTGMLILFRRFFPEPHLGSLILQIACAGVVYGAGLTWLFFTHEPMGIEIWGRVSQSVPRLFSR